METLIEYFVALTGENVDNGVAIVYLELAKEKILNRMCPFGYDSEVDIPDKYLMTLVELAVRLYNRRGGEGEVSHSENGVSRTYGSVDDEDILSRITPIGKVH